MTAMDFPNSPALNAVFTVGATRWIYNGTRWTTLESGVDLDIRKINENEKTVHGYGIAPPGETYTTSATYSGGMAYSGGTFQVSSFTKLLGSTASKLLVTMSISCRGVNSVGTAQFGVRINGTDYDVIQGYHNSLNIHRGWTNTIEISSLAAGTYNCEGLVRTSTGLNLNLEDTFSLTVREKLI